MGAVGAVVDLRTYLGLVRFSHTIFALPFAVIATLIALRIEVLGDPSIPIIHWVRISLGILLCMVSARTAAMAFNRLVDCDMDGRNPRTANRHLPQGLVGQKQVQRVVVVSSLVFITSTLLFLPNWLPLILSLPVLAWLLTYSFAKRFTRFAHLWLGIALGLSPLAAWVAIRGAVVFENPTDIFPALVLAAVVVTWVTGFDIIYACQDQEFDASEGLYSLPAHYGVRGALRAAAAFHVLTVGFLVILPTSSPVLGVYTRWAIGVISVLLVLEHWLVRPDDLSRVNQAFFTVNAGIGMLLLAGVCSDIFL